MPGKDIYCKICGVVLQQSDLKAHLKEHTSTDPADTKSIFGVR